MGNSSGGIWNFILLRPFKKNIYIYIYIYIFGNFVLMDKFFLKLLKLFS